MSRKIAAALVSILCLVGALALGTVYHFLSGAVRNQVDQRALMVATNLGDGVAARIEERNAPSLHALVTKYAVLNELAYAVVQDGQGRLLAHSFRTLPSELAGSLSGEDLRDTRRRAFHFNGQEVYETRVPIREGQLGAIRVGIWRAAVEQEIQQAFRPLVLVILGILLVAVVISVILARAISHPLLQLNHAADQMSRGDLDTPVNLKTYDEVSDLALSLERMRASLKAAMLRLNLQNIGHQAER